MGKSKDLATLKDIYLMVVTLTTCWVHLTNSYK